MTKSITIAIVQRGPKYLDIQASLQLAHHYIQQAAKANAQLIVFGESWLSGYPVWLDYCPQVGQWDHPATKAVFRRMYQNSLRINGPEVKQLCDWAKSLHISIVMGCNEAGYQQLGTIFNSFLVIDEQGQLRNHHRKLMPTYTEKMVYGLGDAVGIKSVELGWGAWAA